MAILGISERYSKCSSLGTSESEKTAYSCTHYSINNERNANYKRYYTSSSDIYAYIENEIKYNEISAIYSAEELVNSERCVFVKYFNTETSDRYAYLPSYISVPLLRNPDVAQLFSSERFIKSVYCSALTERTASAFIGQSTERFCKSSYRTYTLKNSDRYCSYIVESGNLVERYVFCRAYDTKYTITINTNEQDFEYVPNIETVEYNLYSDLTVILEEHFNVFDIIQLPRDISQLDTFILYKNANINNELVWNCKNLRSTSILDLPTKNVGDFKVFDGYFVFNYPIVTYSISYLIIKEKLQFPEKTSALDLDALNESIKNIYSEELLDGFNSVREYQDYLFYIRNIIVSLDGSRKSLDYTYLDTIKTCIPIPFQLKIHSDLYYKGLNSFIFRYNIIPFNYNRNSKNTNKVLLNLL